MMRWIVLISIFFVMLFHGIDQAQSLAPIMKKIPMTLNSNHHRHFVNNVGHDDGRRNRKSSLQEQKLNNKGTMSSNTSTTSLSLSSSLLVSQAFGLSLPVGLGLTKRNTNYLISGIVLLVGYHVRLFWKEKNGTPSWRTTQANTREKWSRYVRDTEGWLYAVQTLRNAITANTFLATTVLSLLTLIAGRIWDILRHTTTVDGGRTRLIAQFISISTCMLASAYEFLQSARLMTHAGFMFPVVSKETKVDKIMRRSQSCQWKGLRWLYISIAMITWTLGGEGMFLFASVCLLNFFRAADEPPTDTGEPTK